VGNSASVAAIGTAQKAATTDATITQPTHPDPTANGPLLNVTPASLSSVFTVRRACGGIGVGSVKICSRLDLVALSVPHDRPAARHDESHDADSG
jgi:hypothetical protein